MTDVDSKKCPYCQLINPKSAQRCDCGFEFSGYLVTPQERETAKIFRRKTGIRWILIGVGLLILGAALTLGISWGLSKAGFSVVFYGLVFAGLAGIGRGIMLILGIR